ncbi:MAG: GyrI-like domain-containing protein [Puia sp.]|nr:GyrI-like domain-containing protein [Puia sp.]
MRSLNGAGPNRLETEMDYRKRINLAMRYIRDHAETRLTITDIARQAHFSPFHFHRIFTAFVGETIGDYTTRTRMARAALLIENGMSVAETAARSGYKTSSSFIQVFKYSFGILPSKFRGSGKKVYAQKRKENQTADTDAPVADFRNLPTLSMLTIRNRVPANEDFTAIAGQAFDTLHRYLERQHILEKVSMRLGILRDFDLLTAKDCGFDACAVIPDSIAPVIKRPVIAGTIEQGTWAVFRHRGPYDTLWQTWNRIYRSWHPTGGMRLRDNYPFEVYLNNRRTTEASRLLTEIYIPVEDPPANRPSQKDL